MATPNKPLTVIVTRIVNTCPAAPSQWEGVTSDNRRVYIRYRHGGLRIGIGRTQDEAVADTTTYTANLGDGYGMDYDELCQLAPDWLQLPEEEDVIPF